MFIVYMELVMPKGECLYIAYKAREWSITITYNESTIVLNPRHDIETLYNVHCTHVPCTQNTTCHVVEE